jgi:hypothetical protein
MMENDIKGNIKINIIGKKIYFWGLWKGQKNCCSKPGNKLPDAVYNNWVLSPQQALCLVGLIR